LGSERVEAEIKSILPQTRTLRWDWETTREKHSHEMILTHFAAHRADVLIGTQMLAKGLDLPLVTLVGIVLADVGLYLPDPFAGERLFQLLTQVAGRAGSSERGGKVVLQTFDPANQVIQSAARHDVNGFYQYELEQRRRLGYPPFSRLVRLEFRHRDASIARAEAQKLAGKLGELLSNGPSSRLHPPAPASGAHLSRRTMPGGVRRVQVSLRMSWKQTTMIGPVPSFFAKLGGYYRWQIILRGPDPVSVLREETAARWLRDWRVEVDPISLL
jgi:primosomal protein N' (replication factor Y)